MTGLPPWLIAARATPNRDAVPFADSEAEHTCPQVGDIRAAGPIEEGSSQPHRLVCVLDTDAEFGFATVALATNELDLATPEDVIVRRDSSGAPFDLLLELGIVAPLWWAQLGPRLGTVRIDGAQNDPELRSAMPLRWQEDIRWTFKESELRDLQVLAADCARTVIDHADTAIVPEVDPAMVAECLSNNDPSMVRLLDFAGRPRCAPMPLRSAAELCRMDDRSLGPDLLAVLHTVLHETLRSDQPPAPHTQSSPVEWSPPRRAARDPMVDEVANARLQRGVRTMRLITRQRFWATEARPDYCIAHLPDGLVQVLPEEL